MGKAAWAEGFKPGKCGVRECPWLKIWSIGLKSLPLRCYKKDREAIEMARQPKIGKDREEK